MQRGHLTAWGSVMPWPAFRSRSCVRHWVQLFQLFGESCQIVCACVRGFSSRVLYLHAVVGRVFFTSRQDAVAQNGSRRRLQDDVDDDATRLELSEIKCTTHKAGKPHEKQPAPRGRSARSGGFLVACTPDGFIADAFEFMGAESLGFDLRMRPVCGPMLWANHVTGSVVL